MSARICGSSNGSTAVEFSGQTTKSGFGARPALDVGREPGGLGLVLGGDLSEVRQDVGAVPGDVALHRGHVDVTDLIGGVRRDQRHRGERQHTDNGCQRHEPAPATMAPVRRSEQRAAEREDQADPGRPDEGQRAGHGGADDGVRQPAPRHAAGRPGAADDSIATQATASQTGAAGSRRSGTTAAPSTPYQTVWVRDRPSHGTVPTTCSHHSRVTWNETPNTRPGIQARRAGSPSVTTKNAATANGSTTYRWIGGKAKASASPATRATRQRVRMLRR